MPFKLSRRDMLVAAGAVTTAAATANVTRAASPQLPKIGLEEHIMFPDFVDYLAETKQNIRPELFDKVVPVLSDFGQRRLDMMDQVGMEKAILSISGPGVQIEPDTAKATKLAKSANDRLAKEIQKQPARYGGFAHLALQDPKAAADELERCMKELGFQGAMINGETLGIYLDDRRYDVFWERVAALKAAIYIHPGNPPQMASAYKDHPELWGPVWSWAAETCTHAMRLVFSGTFDRYPDARIILGHMGETLPIQLWRLDSRLPISNQKYKLEKKPSEYMRQNVYLTTSGVCQDSALRCALDSFGAENVMFSLDYPFEDPIHAARWIETAKISDGERHAVAYSNAAKLLRL
jgi:2,3-dihydroxybenzoate decarboxylase